MYKWSISLFQNVGEENMLDFLSKIGSALSILPFVGKFINYIKRMKSDYRIHKDWPNSEAMRIVSSLYDEIREETDDKKNIKLLFESFRTATQVGEKTLYFSKPEDKQIIDIVYQMLMGDYDGDIADTYISKKKGNTLTLKLRNKYTKSKIRKALVERIDKYYLT